MPKITITISDSILHDLDCRVASTGKSRAELIDFYLADVFGKSPGQTQFRRARLGAKDSKSVQRPTLDVGMEKVLRFQFHLLTAAECIAIHEAGHGLGLQKKLFEHNVSVKGYTDNLKYSRA